jgi:putative FmdB family regulatory protein
MPIYEYKCKSCAALTSAFVRNVEKETPPSCQRCGGKTARALSRFALGAGARPSRDADFSKTPKSLDDYKDPRQIGRWVEEKFDQYGMDVPDQAREMIDAARDGELPDVVKDI